MRFNLNDNVRVKIKPQGVEIMRRRWNEIGALLGPFKPPKVDAEGWTRFQLWALMQEFGPHIRMGFDVPIETEIDLEVETRPATPLPPTPAAWNRHDADAAWESARATLRTALQEPAPVVAREPFTLEDRVLAPHAEKAISAEFRRMRATGCQEWAHKSGWTVIATSELKKLRAQAPVEPAPVVQPLTFDALRAANRARLPQFKNKHGALAHAKADGSDWSPAQWLQAVVGELGEYANVRKKFERGDLSADEFTAMARDELADVQTYLDILAFQVGVDLGAATVDKFNRVSERVQCDVRLSAAPSQLVEDARPTAEERNYYQQWLALGRPQMPRAHLLEASAWLYEYAADMERGHRIPPEGKWDDGKVESDWNELQTLAAALEHIAKGVES